MANRTAIATRCGNYMVLDIYMTVFHLGLERNCRVCSPRAHALYLDQVKVVGNLLHDSVVFVLSNGLNAITVGGCAQKSQNAMTKSFCYVPVLPECDVLQN